MAEPSDLPSEVISAAHAVEEPTRRKKAKKDLQASRRTEALSLRLAGLTYEQIGERLKISPSGAANLIARSLSRAEQMSVDQLRATENARLDRAQMAIWPQVLQGDQKAIGMFLRISAARRQMNGLNAPVKLNISMSIKQEMEAALNDLEALVLDADARVVNEIGSSEYVDAELMEEGE